MIRREDKEAKEGFVEETKINKVTNGHKVATVQRKN